MTRTVALIVVGLLILWLLKLTRDQKEIWLLLNSLSVVPGEIRLAEDAGTTNIKGGGLWIAGPHGIRGPELYIRTVPGMVDSFPYDHSDGRVSREKRVQGGGFVIGLTTPTLPDMPLPPRIRLEFRDDTLRILTWMAKVENAEWSEGDPF